MPKAMRWRETAIAQRAALASLALAIASASGCSAEGGGDVEPADAVSDSAIVDSGMVDSAKPESEAASDSVADEGVDAEADATPTTLDLHEATLFDNPTDLADWPVTTLITSVEFQYKGADGVRVEFSKRDDGSWPDVTPPGWTGPLEYTMGFAEKIGGKWYASAAIQLWRGLDASGGNVAEDVVTKAQCTAFGSGSSCQVAKNWYYDSRWGALSGYQPATGEVIGVFVVAGNLRGVTDGSQSPVRER
jgi:hypothetical protein